MAYRAFNTKYTKQMISRAKRIKEGPAAKGDEEIVYAFMPDKATGEDEFALDRGIAPDALFGKLRTHANAERGKQKKKKLTKGSWGTCRIKGKTLFVTPDQEVPSLRMLLKKRLLSPDFKEFKLSEVRILKPGQEPPEDDTEEQPEEKAVSKKSQRKEAAGETQETAQPAKKDASGKAATSSTAKTVQKEAATQEAPAAAAPKGDVNPFSGEAVAASSKSSAKEPATKETSAKTSAKEPAADPKQAAKEKKEAQKQRAAFKKARQTWVSTRDKALEDLEVVKEAFRKEYMDDPQIKDVNKRIRELDSVMDDLGDDLREALDAYVATPLAKKKALEEQAEKARKLLTKFSKYVEKSQLLAAVDGEQGVGDAAKVKVKAPLAKALKQLAKTIG